jgi:competence protein ComFC
LTPTITKRVLLDGFEVFSFYKYTDIKELIHTKHKFIGYFIYNILAKESFLKFAKEFKSDGKIYSFSCDDDIKTGYSHNAILNRHLKSPLITPVHSTLRAKNSVKYSGKSLQFRQNNPRNFIYSFKSNINAILIDDIITTGTTLNEAKETLQKHKVNVLFALTLADARD